eukprot:1137047-Rhodomonas_salina.1
MTRNAALTLELRKARAQITLLSNLPGGGNVGDSAGDSAHPRAPQGPRAVHPPLQPCMCLRNSEGSSVGDSIGGSGLHVVIWDLEVTFTGFEGTLAVSNCADIGPGPAEDLVRSQADVDSASYSAKNVSKFAP